MRFVLPPLFCQTLGYCFQGNGNHRMTKTRRTMDRMLSETGRVFCECQLSTRMMREANGRCRVIEQTVEENSMALCQHDTTD